MSVARFLVENIAEEVRDAFSAEPGKNPPSAFAQVAQAVTATMREVGADFKREGRASIAAGGFGTNWQNAWRVDVFPNRAVSVNASVYGFHNIPYSLIFEEGGSIHGKSGLLWIPLPSMPKKSGRRVTPKKLAELGAKLSTIRAKSGPPLLGAKIRVPRGDIGKRLKPTLGQLTSGTSGSEGIIRTVPLYFGLSSVTLRKRFDISGVAVRLSNQLAARYFKHVEG